MLCIVVGSNVSIAIVDARETSLTGVQNSNKKKIVSPLRGSWTMLRILVESPALGKKLDPPLDTLPARALRWSTTNKNCAPLYHIPGCAYGTRSFNLNAKNAKTPWCGRGDTPLPHPPPARALRALACVVPRLKKIILHSRKKILHTAMIRAPPF